LPHDYSEFLLTANGIKIEFYLRRVPEEFYPAFTFQIAGIPEALDLTREWRSRIDKFVRDGQESSSLTLSQRDRRLVDTLVLVNPVSKILIDPDTGCVFAEEFSELFSEHFLQQVAISLVQYFNRSVEAMMRDGYIEHN